MRLRESLGSLVFTSTNVSHQQRADLSIAHGALTNSKRPECLVKGVYPTHLSAGRGCFVWDTSSKRYIDFICGLGSNLLGYGNTEVTAAIQNQAAKGCTLSLGTPLELELAELLQGIFPFVERVKFLKTGTEACLAALKIARAKTGRMQVLSHGYHGWTDEFVSLTPPALGVPEQRYIRAFKDPDEITLSTAAVILEPVLTDDSHVRREFLKAVRDRCDKTGALLIFDEVITGFRFPRMGVSTFWGIQPDLICLGKAIANGLPLSVVGGREAVMNCGEYFVSSTFAGETVSLAAAQKTITLLQTKYSLDNLWEKGKQFLTAFNSIWPEKLKIEGYPTRGVFQGDPMIRALFWQEACRAGLLFGPSWFFNFHHVEVMDGVLNTCRDIMTRIQTGAVRLEGAMPASPFAAKQRGQS